MIVAAGDGFHTLEPGRGRGGVQRGRCRERRAGQCLVPGNLTRAVGVREQGLDLRGEDHALAIAAEVERLHTEMVAGHHQNVAAPVPEHESEHATYVVEEGQPLLLVEVHEHLAVGASTQLLAAAWAVRGQRAVVVDLPVGDQDYRAVRADQGLSAALGVHQRQAGEGEADGSVPEEFLSVGSTMCQGPCHGRQDDIGASVQIPPVDTGKAAQSAHSPSPFADSSAHPLVPTGVPIPGEPVIGTPSRITCCSSEQS